MASRPFQGYTLFQMLKAAKPDEVVKREDIAKALGVNEGSVPIYFFGLKKFFNVECETVKVGRSVIGYKLLTRDADVPENGRRGNAIKAVAKTPKVNKEKAVKPLAVASVTKSVKVKKQKDAPIEVEDLEISEISDTELSDIRSQLGL